MLEHWSAYGKPSVCLSVFPTTASDKPCTGVYWFSFRSTYRSQPRPCTNRVQLTLNLNRLFQVTDALGLTLKGFGAPI